MKKFTVIAVVALFIIGILGMGVMYSSKQQPASPPVILQDETPIEVVEVTPNPNLGEESPELSDLRAGGSSYLDPEGVYGFLYPSDYTIDRQGDFTRIFKRGEMARPQSEMSDGVLMNFQSRTLNGKSLAQFVDEEIEATKQNAEITMPKTKTELNVYTGFMYEAEGLGSARYVMLQKDSTSPNVLVLIISVMDPQEKGYQREVDAVMETIELHK